MALNFIPTWHENPVARARVEKHLLQKHYKFLQVSVSGTQLTCKGSCQPTPLSIVYEYKLKYTPGRPPSVYTASPKIPYHKDIHMYPQDSSLCLYYPGDASWNARSHLFDSVVPWAHEWFVFFELYQLTGEWKHPAVAHGQNNKLK